MAREMRGAIEALTDRWRRLGHEIGFGRFATLGTIGFDGRFDYAAIGTVSNVASRLCDEAKPKQILISPRVSTKVENAVKVEPVGEFELKAIRRPLAAYLIFLRLKSAKWIIGLMSSTCVFLMEISLSDLRFSIAATDFRFGISEELDYFKVGSCS